MIDGFTQNSASLLANDDFTQGAAGTGIGATTSNANIDRNPRRLYPIVEVVSPETLPEGYTFDVEVDHDILTVTVPHGGVRKGNTFRGQTQAKIQDERNAIRIPVGGWKDSLLDFCTLGPLHPSFCMGFFCPLIALGQIYTRLNLNWHGRPQEYEATSTTDSGPQYKYSSRAFKIMIVITIFYKIGVPLYDAYKGPDLDPESTVIEDPFLHTFYIIFYLFCAILIARTRTYIRSRYEIQATIIEESMERAPCSCCRQLAENDSVPFGCVEDCAISCLCLPCVVTQMSRHTAPYDTYEGRCFSSTGLPSHAPSMA